MKAGPVKCAQMWHFGGKTGELKQPSTRVCFFFRQVPCVQRRFVLLGSPHHRRGGEGELPVQGGPRNALLVSGVAGAEGRNVPEFT